MKKMMAIALMLALLGTAYAVAQNQEDPAEIETIEIAEEAVVATEIDELDEIEEIKEIKEIKEIEEIPEIVDISGEILEITQEYILIGTQMLGEVQVNLAEGTVIEGAHALEVGQTIVVMYNGMMTRSLPAQITAMHIGVYVVEGTVTEVEEDRVIIRSEDTAEEIVVTLPENAPELNVGDRVIAYTNGAMTMSLPPQMNAIAIVFADEATPSEATPSEATPAEAM